MKASAARTASGVPRWRRGAGDSARSGAARQPRRPELLRQQRHGLVEKGARLRLIDRRQALQIEIGERLLRPIVGPAGVRMNGDRRRTAGRAHEHLQRVALDALERRRGAVDQQPLRARGRSAAPGCRQAARAPAARGGCASSGVVGDIDVDGGDGAAGDADASVRPALQTVEFVIGGRARAVLGPIGIVAPAAAAMNSPGFLVPGMIGMTG